MWHMSDDSQASPAGSTPLCPLDCIGCIRCSVPRSLWLHKMFLCLPENDALRKGFVKIVCKFSQHPAYYSKSVSLRYKEVCHYFEYQICYFFKQQNPQWDSNYHQQCLFNIHLESSFPSWKSKKSQWKSFPNLMAVKNGACQEHWLTQLRVQLFGDAYVYGLSYRLVQEMEREFHIFP